ncbi:MAG: hypothetical protein KME55_41080 [Nostoc indistinguendum CM1-VF10]|nr:hypothetical protein [Nostoc indistinguendum CM1-VF10]
MVTWWVLMPTILLTLLSTPDELAAAQSEQLPWIASLQPLFFYLCYCAFERLLVVSSIAVSHFHPHDVITVDPDCHYIFGLAVFGVVGLIHDGCNDFAIACG